MASPLDDRSRGREGRGGGPAAGGSRARADPSPMGRAAMTLSWPLGRSRASVAVGAAILTLAAACNPRPAPTNGAPSAGALQAPASPILGIDWGGAASVERPT